MNFAIFSRSRLFFGIFVIIVGVGALHVLYPRISQIIFSYNPHVYSAVFMANGQVYFGHINLMTPSSLKLTDVYYLKANTDLKPDAVTGNQGAQVSLVKLGEELHSPEDMMVINRSQVLFFEEMKSKGTVMDAILADQKKG